MSAEIQPSARRLSLQQRCARRVLAVFGWRVLFSGLPGPRGVVIVYPHTSNWDFVLGVLAKWQVGLPFRWLGKEALFRGACGWVLGPLLRAWGGEPIERHARTGAIERLAVRMRAADWYWLGMSPEGTRKYQPGWRSGFYQIALAAQVPIGLACLDYAKKEIRLTEFFVPSGDRECDLQHLQAAFAGVQGRRPACAAPVRFLAAHPPGSTSRSEDPGSN